MEVESVFNVVFPPVPPHLLPHGRPPHAQKGWLTSDDLDIDGHDL